jgi:hypothetical protein
MIQYFDQGRPLLWLGILGLALAVVCSAVAATRGMIISPEGDLSKAISFDAAVAIYLITIALYVQFAGFTSKGRQRWMRWLVGLSLGTCIAVAWQTAVGLPVTQFSTAMLVAGALTLTWVFSLLIAARYTLSRETPHHRP